MCVTLVGRNKEGLIPFIEKKAGVKFERTGAPQPADMARVAGDPHPRVPLALHRSCILSHIMAIARFEGVCWPAKLGIIVRAT